MPKNKSKELVQIATLPGLKLSTLEIKHIRKLVKEKTHGKSNSSRNLKVEIPILAHRNAEAEVLKWKKNPADSKRQLYKTQWLTESLNNWLFQLANEGWTLYMVRVLCLGPGAKLDFHKDGVHRDLDRWRLHVPIVTNKKCFLQWKTGSELISIHLPVSEQPYLIRVDQIHRAINQSKSWRIHLVASLRSVPTKTLVRMKEGFNSRK